MRKNKEHKMLVEKYYPDGCDLDKDHDNPIFSNADDSQEIKEKIKNDFLNKINEN